MILRFLLTRLCGLGLFLVTSAAVAQPATGQAAPAPPRAAPGTFQVVQLTNKVQVGLTTDALAEIERRRQEDEEVSWQFSPYARVRIPSKRQITAPGFQPLAPMVLGR